MPTGRCCGSRARRSVRLAAANSMNFAVGALWSEGGAGTNAIGTALAADHAVQVFAAEHFNEVVQAWTCAAAPVHDPDTGDAARRDRPHEPDEHRAPALVRGGGRDRGRGRGAPALSHARAGRAAALALRDRVLGGSDDRALVTSSGRVIATSPQDGCRPSAWRCRPTAASSRCRRACPRSPSRWIATGAFLMRRLEHAPAGRSGGAVQLRLLGDEHPHVVVDGRSLPLGRRQAEILALLCLRPGGLTTEQLGSEVYGDDASNSTRPRRGLAAAQAARAGDRDGALPASSATSSPTSGACARCCARGAVQEAAELYAGPLLPLSDAPGVERERDGARGLDAPRGDDRRRPRGAVGVAPDALRARRPGGVAAGAARRWTSATRGAARRRRRWGACARSRWEGRGVAGLTI